MSNITSALFSLRQQSVARGFGGRLSDFDIKLCEDSKTISVWAFYEMDSPLMAHIELPQPIDPTTFDAAPYYRAALNFSVDRMPIRNS
jgi:hypothetical protein